MPWKEAQAGHGIPGRTNGILFLEEIVRPQCPGCNVFGGGRLEVFVRKLIEIYTLEGYDEFLRIKHAPRKFYIHELLEMATEFKRRADEYEVSLCGGGE